MKNTTAGTEFTLPAATSEKRNFLSHKAPPLPWIEERVATLQEVLERRTEKSAPLMRKLLGKIKLEPVNPDPGRPFLRARSQLQTLALYEVEPGAGEEERGRMTSDAGSNSLHWWVRGESMSNPWPLQ